MRRDFKIESQNVKKSKENINRDGKYWLWCHNHMMKGKFDAMYTNHLDNKYNEWAEKNHRTRY